MSSQSVVDQLVPRHIKSSVNTSSPEFEANVAEWKDILKTLDDRLEEATSAGPDKYVKAHRKKGQLSGKKKKKKYRNNENSDSIFKTYIARERINLLLDENSPFLEIGALVGFGQKEYAVGGSVVGGLGLVSGVLTMVYANVPTVGGGAMNYATTLKIHRFMEIAMTNRIPIVTLVHSAGADLKSQFNVFHYGAPMFRNQAIMSKDGVPQCCVVFGNSTAAGAYIPGMSDYVIMVKKQAQIYLGGPQLVQMATGEINDPESLGGADMHSRISGVSDALAFDEYDGIRKAREWELLGIVSANIRNPYDAHEVIIRLADGSRFTAFKPNYGSGLVCGWAHIHGIPVGFISNNTVIFPQESNKGVQFIQLCNMKNIPIIFLQNITGFMVGRQYEEEGSIKAGARFINAVSNCVVPMITIMLGSSYGAGNFAMCGRGYAPRFLFSWPNSKCAVMGAEQLSGVMDLVMRQSYERAGVPVDEEKVQKQKNYLQKTAEKESDVYFTSARLRDDAIISPLETRDILGFCLVALHNNTVSGGNLYGVSRM
ncbi:ClpP/crotonase-like domain-containing protein [Gongronella butleri]|nr:ClpP/crotonase-like domain-containing protein [Gongronella butleri]